MLAEAIEVLATIKGVDLVSGVLDKVGLGFDRLSAEAQAAADAAEAAAARLDEAMLQTASGTDAVTLASAQATAERARLDAATQAQAAAERELVAAEREAATASDGDTAAQTRLREAARALAAAQRESVKAANASQAAQARLAATVDAAAGSNLAAARATATADAERGAAAEGAASASAGAASKVKNAAFMASAAVAAIGYESIKAAMNFQTLTTRLVTTAGESRSSLEEVRQGILAISDQTGVSASDLAKSMYTVESAGYHGAAGLDVLKASTQGAATEGADFATVSNAVTDVLKDYHLKASQAANVTSQMTAAVSVGKSNFQTLSASMANILPLASAVHVRFADAAGVLAEMTSHGVTAQRASQNLAMALRSLEGPSKAMQKEWKGLGISTQDVTNSLSKRGLGGTLEWLSQVAAKGAPALKQTYAGALKATIGTAAGLNVMLETTGKNSKETANAIATIGKAAADSHGNVMGFADVQKTAAFQLDKAKVAMENMGITLGTALLPLVTQLANDATKVITPITQWISKHEALTKTIFELVAALLAVVGVIKVVTVVTEALAGAMALLEASPVIAAVTAIVLILIYAYTHFKWFRDAVSEVMHVVEEVIKVVIQGLIIEFKFLVAAAVGIWHALVATWDALVGAAKSVWGFLTGIWHDIVSVTTTVWDSITAFFKKWWPLLLLIFATPIALLLGTWNHFHKEIESTAKTVWSAIKSFFAATWTIIKDVARVGWEAFRFVVLDPIISLWHDIQPVIHAIESFFSAAWHVIQAAAKAGWSLIKSMIIQPIVDTWNTLVSWTGKFNQIGTDIVNGIINGIKSASGWLFSEIGNLAGGALNAAKSILGIKSPSRKFADEVGAQIPSGVAVGVNQNAAIAKRAVANLSSTLTVTGRTSLGGTPLGAGFTVGAGLVGGAGGTTYNLHIHAEGATLMTDRDMDAFVQKIEKRLATIKLPSGGYRSRF